MKRSKPGASGSSATTIVNDSCSRCKGTCLARMRLILLLLCSLFGTGEEMLFGIFRIVRGQGNRDV